MCKAIQDIRQESFEQGVEQGIEREREKMVLAMVILLRPTGMTEEEIIEKIADSTGISEEDIFRYVCGGSCE